MSSPFEDFLGVHGNKGPGIPNKKKKERVLKTFIAKKEWVDEFEAFHARADELIAEMKKFESKVAYLWCKIEEETDTYQHMRYNQQLKWIEVVSEDDEEEDDPDKA